MSERFDGPLRLADALHPPAGARPRRRRRGFWWLLLIAALGTGSCALLRARPLLWASLRYRAPPTSYLVPVEGLGAAELVSTWHAPRSGGRLHEGADLFAPKGTRVRSAVRGEVYRIRNGGLGGKAITVLGEGPAFYYYAHLDTWVPGLKEGQPIAAGQTLGTVGNTGNAKTTPPHLHFGVYPIQLRGPVRPVDPIVLLKAKGRPRGPRPAASETPAPPDRS